MEGGVAECNYYQMRKSHFMSVPILNIDCLHCLADDISPENDDWYSAQFRQKS